MTLSLLALASESMAPNWVPEPAVKAAVSMEKLQPFGVKDFSWNFSELR